MAPLTEQKHQGYTVSHLVGAISRWNWGLMSFNCLAKQSQEGVSLHPLHLNTAVIHSKGLSQLVPTSGIPIVALTKRTLALAGLSVMTAGGGWLGMSRHTGEQS